MFSNPVADDGNKLERLVCRRGQMLFLERLGAMRSPGLVLNANMVYLLQPAAINRPCNYIHVHEERICRNSLSKERPATQPRSRCAALDPPSPHFQRVSIEYVVRECHKTVCVCVWCVSVLLERHLCSAEEDSLILLGQHPGCWCGC